MSDAFSGVPPGRGHLIDRRGVDFDGDDSALLVKLESPGNYSIECVCRVTPADLARLRDSEGQKEAHAFLQAFFLPAVWNIRARLKGPNAPK